MERASNDDREPQTASCGPRPGSPAGVRAQTRTITEGGATRARTYYGNATDRALSGVLTPMQPGGRTAQVSCPIGARDRTGSCETPHERTVAARERYAAVAEIAAKDASELLRAGSGHGNVRSLATGDAPATGLFKR